MSRGPKQSDWSAREAPSLAEFEASDEKLGIATVATVAWTTDQVMRRLLPSEERPNAGQKEPVARDRFCAVIDQQDKPGGQADQTDEAKEKTDHGLQP